MALIEISDMVMVNTSRIDYIESTPVGLVIHIEDIELRITKDPKETLAKIMYSMSIPESMMKNNQFYGG